MSEHDQDGATPPGSLAPPRGAPVLPAPTPAPAVPYPGSRPPAPPAPPLAADTVPVRHVEPLRPPTRDLPAPLRDLLDADGTAVIVLRLDPPPGGAAAGAPDVVEVNPAMLDLLGADTADDLLPGRPARSVLDSFLDHLPQELREGGRAPTRPATWSGDVDHQGPDGTARLLRATVRVAPDPASLSLLLHDVTAARERIAELRHRATHDPLTGLANRARIMRHLAAAIRDQRGHTGHVAALFVDLDHLKYVNDAFGHLVGDRLLVSTAERLGHAIRPDDLVARIGGDEFLVVSGPVPDAVTALDLAERIRRALSGRLRIADLDLDFSVSIGVALTDPDVLDLTDDDAASVLVSNADTAMYRAKQDGRGRCTVFTSQMRSNARERTEMASALARAVEHDELEIDYQPVFATVRRRASGAEALVRWRHPAHGRLDPAAFLSVAEESGTIARIGEFVLDRSLADLRGWIRSGTVDDGFVVHVNVSRVQLASASFVNLVLARLQAHSIAPRQLVLEARETSLLGRAPDVDRSIRALRRAGIQVAVDNFGTGPKALAVMTDIGADVLKLDGALALPSGSSDTDIRLVRAIVLLAHALEMDVVAERVSGTEQLHRLVAAGCDHVQGNLLAPPVPAAQFSPEPPGFGRVSW